MDSPSPVEILLAMQLVVTDGATSVLPRCVLKTRQLSMIMVAPDLGLRITGFEGYNSALKAWNLDHAVFSMLAGMLCVVVYHDGHSVTNPVVRTVAPADEAQLQMFCNEANAILAARALTRPTAA